jgi:hypothetical protein
MALQKHPLLVGVYQKDLEKMSDKATRQEIKQAVLDVIFENVVDSPAEASYEHTVTKPGETGSWSGIIVSRNKWRTLLAKMEIRDQISSGDHSLFRIEGTPNETHGVFQMRDFYSENRVLHHIVIQSCAPDGSFGVYSGNAEALWKRVTEKLYIGVKRRTLIETCDKFGI